MNVAWRLTHKRFSEQALSGNGGLFAAGRWHSQGHRIVYSSSSLALATLELLVNLQIKRQLEQYVKTKLLIPQTLIESLEPNTLSGFLDDPERFDSQDFGDTWLREARSCVLEVPSRVVLEEMNYLLNPLHPDFGEIMSETKPYQADIRLWQ